MDLFQAIHTRYSHKENFLPDPVPLADLEKITHAGIAAPNGANRQLVRLIILPDREALAPLRKIVQHGGLHTAPAAIAVLTTDQTPSDTFNFEKEDYSAAVENMLLAAVALGYTSLWLDYPYFDTEKERLVKAALNITNAYRLWATLPVGKPDGAGSRREKMPAEERMFYGQYGVRKNSSRTAAT
jgi:nitroreductase